jgi:hypothetical protein
MGSSFGKGDNVIYGKRNFRLLPPTTQAGVVVHSFEVCPLLSGNCAACSPFTSTTVCFVERILFTVALSIGFSLNSNAIPVCLSVSLYSLRMLLSIDLGTSPIILGTVLTPSSMQHSQFVYSLFLVHPNACSRSLRIAVVSCSILFPFLFDLFRMRFSILLLLCSMSFRITMVFFHCMCLRAFSAPRLQAMLPRFTRAKSTIALHILAACTLFSRATVLTIDMLKLIE